MNRIPRALVAAVAVLACIGLSAPSAVADDDEGSGGGGFFQPPTPYEEEYEFDPGCPNVDLLVKGEVEGVDSLRNVPGSDGQAFLLKNRYEFEDVVTNLATGNSVTVAGHALFKEISAEFVPLADVPPDVIPPEGLIGPVYKFTAIERGTPWIVKDSQGRTVLVERGLAVFEALFDTLGDSEPGATFLTGETLRTVGPHPIALGEVDLCVLLEQLTDNDPTNDPPPLFAGDDDDDHDDDDHDDDDHDD